MSLSSTHLALALSTLHQVHKSTDVPFSLTVTVLPSLQQVLTTFAREILSLMSQPEYLALLRVIFAEAPRFPLCMVSTRNDELTFLPQRGKKNSSSEKFSR